MDPSPRCLLKQGRPHASLGPECPGAEQGPAGWLTARVDLAVVSNTRLHAAVKVC